MPRYLNDKCNIFYYKIQQIRYSEYVFVKISHFCSILGHVASYIHDFVFTKKWNIIYKNNLFHVRR